MINIHIALTTIRKYHQLTQKQLAEKLGISASHISEMERGINTVNIDILERYAEFQGVPLSHLIMFAENIMRSEIIPPSEERILKKNHLLNMIKWRVRTLTALAQTKTHP